MFARFVRPNDMDMLCVKRFPFEVTSSIAQLYVNGHAEYFFSHCRRYFKRATEAEVNHPHNRRFSRARRAVKEADLRRESDDFPRVFALNGEAIHANSH